jgi:hypothetical protein
MNNTIFNQNAFLRTQVAFPTDMDELVLELDKGWVDTASAINNRIISLFATNKSVITGESWFIFQSRKQQTLRRVYTFGPIPPATDIPAGTEVDIPINIPNFTQFTRIWGTVVTTAIDWRPLPYVDPFLVTTGMALLVGPIAGINNIRIVLGATAQPVTSGLVVLEWLSQV